MKNLGCLCYSEDMTDMTEEPRGKNVRGSESARRYGREPKVHYRLHSGEGDTKYGDSLCGRSVYGTPTDDPVTCEFCLRMGSL